MTGGPHIVLIVIDTLRQDYSLQLNRILKKFGFISYKNIIAPAPWTTPTHASIFTGLYPAFHGTHETKTRKLTNITLQEGPSLLHTLLSELGYKTYLLSANPLISPTFGFKKFDYVDIYPFSPLVKLLSTKERRLIDQYAKKYEAYKTQKLRVILDMCLSKNIGLAVKILIERLIEKPYLAYMATIKKWPLEKGSSKIIDALKKLAISQPSFIFINLMEVHDPYFLRNRDYIVTIKNYINGYLDIKYSMKWQKGYKKEIEYISKKIKCILDILSNKGILQDSLIIITSDHGQLLGEHNRLNHGTFLYDELIQVPLWVRYPNTNIIPLQDEGYISLTRLYNLILTTVRGDEYTIKTLYSPVVFSEVYGIHLSYSGLSLTPQEKTNLMALEKYRIAIYYKNFKGIFNVTDWKFEEIISYDPNTEITEDIVKSMKKEVMKFLKTATLAKAPKIKL